MRAVLVDDSVERRRSRRRALKRRSDVEVVGGAEALDVAAGTLPDAILIDFNLPDIGGTECTQIIRKRLPWARVVAWSGEMAGEEMHRAGADAFVLKGELLDRLMAAFKAPRSET